MASTSAVAAESKLASLVVGAVPPAALVERLWPFVEKHRAAVWAAERGYGSIDDLAEPDRSKIDRSSGWLILAALVMVLLAQDFRIAGVLWDDGLVLIYVSIGRSVAAAVMVFISVRYRQRRKRAGASCRDS